MSNLQRQWRKGLFVPGALAAFLAGVPLVYAAVEAPTGFDNQTNGFTSQSLFDLDRGTFEKVDGIGDGLGPIYNGTSCVECHQSPVTGSVSQVTEQRAGFFDGTTFTDHPGGSLLNDRGIAPGLHEQAFGTDNVRAFRASLNTLGDGFVEAIPDSEFFRIQNAQPAGMKGTIIYVKVREAPDTATRIGRFGWKDQHASLISFAADAYLNEIGITNPLFPTENTMNGASLAAFDSVPDPEDAGTPNNPFGADVGAFARFMRATKAPSSFPDATPNSTTGSQLFVQIGCANCHTTTITTAPAGTSSNGGTFVVPDALGDKIIHPYSDFMLHDVGTGDGIVQNGAATRNMLRTPPLWGLRNRSRLLHDNEAIPVEEAIARHANEAAPVIQSYNNLTTTQKQQISEFLGNL